MSHNRMRRTRLDSYEGLIGFSHTTSLSPVDTFRLVIRVRRAGPGLYF